MNLKDIVAVSGISGLHKVLATRPDGLIIQPFDGSQSRFVSNRAHVFTPLDGITIYTTDDTTELTNVLSSMKKNDPPVSAKSSDAELRTYFKKVLPEHDEEKVYASDIKKIIKWYEILKANDLLKEEKTEKAKVADTKEEKPAKKASAKKTAEPKEKGPEKKAKTTKKPKENE